jgi:hypothetical protein
VPEHDGLESIHNLGIIGAQVVFSVGQSQSTLQQISLEVSKDFIRLICVLRKVSLLFDLGFGSEVNYVNGF